MLAFLTHASVERSDFESGTTKGTSGSCGIPHLCSQLGTRAPKKPAQSKSEAVSADDGVRGSSGRKDVHARGAEQSEDYACGQESLRPRLGGRMKISFRRGGIETA